MPISKTDILAFGDTLKNTLTAIGEQIQYGRDVANLKRIQNNLQNMKNVTQGPDGKSLSMEQIARNLFNVQSDIAGSIRNPSIMNLANTSVGEFFKSALLGAKTREQNDLEINEVKAMNPFMGERADAMMSGIEKSLVDVNPVLFKLGNMDKGYAPHYRTITDPKDDRYEWDMEIMYQRDTDPNSPTYGKLKPNERWIGPRLRTKETPNEMYQRNIDTRSTPTYSNVFSSQKESFSLVKGADGNDYQMGSYGTIKDKNGTVIKLGQIPGGVDFRTGTSTPEQTTPKTSAEYLEMGKKIILGRYDNTRPVGGGLSKAERVWKDLQKNGVNSQYWKDLSEMERRELGSIWNSMNYK